MITSTQIKREWKKENDWYLNPDTKLWLKIGDRATIGDRAMIGNGATIGDRATIGTGATIGDRATIGNRAKIGDRAMIGDRAKIGNGAVVISVLSKYTGTLFIKTDNIEIKIGCECHLPKYWND